MSNIVSDFQGSEVISCENVNSKVQQINSFFPVPIEYGGTGATTVQQARSNLNMETTVQLYHNISGTTGTITLPAQASSCNRWGIYYGYSNIGGYQECDIASGSGTINLYLTYMSNSNNLYTRSALAYYNVSNSQISMSRNQTFVLYENGNQRVLDEKINIYLVVGYM